jgi:hypothetical protein
LNAMFGAHLTSSQRSRWSQQVPLGRGQERHQRPAHGQHVLQLEPGPCSW